MIHEWNVLRTVACLCIVFLHATTEIILINGDGNSSLFQLLRVFLTYATPTFVLLSIIIISNRYKDEIPAGFLTKRFKYILLPFVFFAFIYALNGQVFHDNYNLVQLAEKFAKNVLIGDFTGWFVLAIFQLYLLFWLIKKTKVSTTWVLPLLFFVGLFSLTFLREVPIQDPILRQIARAAFLTWLAYFAIAYVIGKYYDVLIHYLTKYRYVTIMLVLVSLGIIALNFSNGYTTVHSRRIDIIPLVVSMTLMILAFGKVMPRIRAIDIISNYAFGIYLLHRIVQLYVAPYAAEFPTIAGQVGFLFIVSLIICMIVIKIISYVPFSEFLIGKVKSTSKTGKNQATLKKQAG